MKSSVRSRKAAGLWERGHDRKLVPYLNWMSQNIKQRLFVNHLFIPTIALTSIHLTLVFLF